MNTTMIFACLKQKREKALYSKQSVVSVHTFLGERSCTVQKVTEQYKGL